METTIARTHLAQHGLGPEVQDLVEVWTGPGAHGEIRANVTVGYNDGDRRRECAAVSLPGMEEALRMLADRDAVASILSLGIRAMPRAARPAVPDWVKHDPAADRTRRMLARARGLADARADGREPRGRAADDVGRNRDETGPPPF